MRGSNPWIAKILFSAFLVLLVLAARSLAPIPDETYYWTWSSAPARSYFDHPPGVALVLAGARAVLGDDLVALRVLSLGSIAIVLAFSAAAAGRMVTAAQRVEARSLALLLLLGSPMFVIGFLPVTPDPLHGAATAVASYCLVRAVEAGAHRAWAFGAAVILVLTIGLKHYAALIALGAAFGLLMTARGRAVMKDPITWLGVFVGLSLLAPWLVEELGRVESSMGYQYERVFFGRRSRGVVALPLMLGSLLGTLGPVGAGLLMVTSPRLRTYGPWAGGSFMLLLGCLIAVWAGSGEANWPMPALIFVMPAAVAFAVERARLSLAMHVVAVVCVGIMGVLLAHVVHPFLPASRDPTARGVGFERLAEVTRRVARRAGARVIATRSYQTASLLRYHLHDEFPLFELGTARRSQYDLWPRPEVCAGEVLVVVAKEREFPDELGSPVIASEPFERGGEHWQIAAVRLDHRIGATEGRCDRSPP